MTGPEHYREAERYLGALDRILGALDRIERGALPGEASIAAEAQVHATLALAAATALSGISDADKRAWREVAATPAGE